MLNTVMQRGAREEDFLKITENLFARRASGLSRAISGKEAFMYNILFMQPIGTWVFAIWASSLFPGVDLPTTALICIPIAVVVGLFYAVFSASMPRSGGDYVWASRILHPALGFGMNFFFAIALMALGGISFFFFSGPTGLQGFFTFVGMADFGAWIGSTNVTFAMGLIFYAIFAVIITRGVKLTHTVLLICFLSVMSAVIVYIGTLLFLGPEGYKANFNALSGMNYDNVIQAAASTGYPSDFLASSTLLGVALTYFSFTGFNASVYYAGEIKDVRKTQLYAIVGSAVIFGFIVWASFMATTYTLGGRFLGSITYLFATGNPEYKLQFTPYFQNLFSFATRSSVVYFFPTVLGYAVANLAVSLAYLFAGTRMLFAWAFDRIVPTSFAKVDSRFNSPYMAIIVMTGASMFGMALWAYTSIFSYFLYITFGWMVMQGIAAIAGIVFPWRRKDLFETSPEIVRRKVLGIPLISLLGFLTLLASIYIGYDSVAPAYSGAVQPNYLLFTIGLFVTGFIIYGIASAYRRSRGLPLELSFKQLPPE